MVKVHLVVQISFALILSLNLQFYFILFFIFSIDFNLLEQFFLLYYQELSLSL